MSHPQGSSASHRTQRLAAAPCPSGNEHPAEKALEYVRLAICGPAPVRYGGRFLRDIGARCPRDPPGTRPSTRRTRAPRILDIASRSKPSVLDQWRSDDQVRRAFQLRRLPLRPVMALDPAETDHAKPATARTSYSAGTAWPLGATTTSGRCGRWAYFDPIGWRVKPWK